jgi:hypothetical protein
LCGKAWSKYGVPKKNNTSSEYFVQNGNASTKRIQKEAIKVLHTNKRSN